MLKQGFKGIQVIQDFKVFGICHTLSMLGCKRVTNVKLTDFFFFFFFKSILIIQYFHAGTMLFC